MVAVEPPTLKSLTTSRSPFLWTPLKPWPPPLLLVPREIAFWKNQKPFWASPLLSKRSMPKKSCLQGWEADDPGQLALAAETYWALKPFSRMSLPGRPPVPWFQAQLEMSMGSLEPPLVKVVPVVAPCEANSTVDVLALLVVEQSVPSTLWQTRSQSSGRPVPVLFVTALPSSSNTDVSRASAGAAVPIASARSPRRVKALTNRRVRLGVRIDRIVCGCMVGLLSLIVS